MARKSKAQPELTKPNLAKVRQKLINTKKHAEEQPSNAHASANLSRLAAKYPKVAEELA